MSLDKAIKQLRARVLAGVDSQETHRARLRVEAQHVPDAQAERECRILEARLALAQLGLASLMCVHGKIRKVECRKCG
jgi:hypothetical protein